MRIRGRPQRAHTPARAPEVTVQAAAPVTSDPAGQLTADAAQRAAYDTLHLQRPFNTFQPNSSITVDMHFSENAENARSPERAWAAPPPSCTLHAHQAGPAPSLTDGISKALHPPKQGSLPAKQPAALRGCKGPRTPWRLRASTPHCTSRAMRTRSHPPPSQTDLPPRASSTRAASFFQSPRLHPAHPPAGLTWLTWRRTRKRS